MKTRSFNRTVIAVGALGLGIAVAWGQSEAPRGESSDFEVPRTPWGDPDLQGAWDYRTITPLERPRQYGDRAFYTEDEIAELEGRAAERMDAPPGENAPVNLVHAQYMTDPGRFVDESRRTSLVVIPEDGRIPPMTEAAQERQRAARTAGRESDPNKPWLNRAMLERCITRGMPGAILPGLYNNNILITQAPGVVAITHEMVHETRIVPLDGRDYVGLPTYMGESRGRWDGDTLVVETRHFNGEAGYRGAGENMRLTERYTLVGPETIAFELTVEDETTWTGPWTAAFSMRPTDGGFYEYACHEGNYGLRNILENLLFEQQAEAGN
jgi:hypothetical protein